MKFDFDEMSRLYREAPEVFEQQRKQLLQHVINNTSEHLQTPLRVLQGELDQVRMKQPQHFLQLCFTEMSKNLEQMSELWSQVGKLTKNLGKEE